ncbi:SMI1/KNR4 family protein [Capnocytophaga gingivalis]|uniref:SMI1/KNR4 family protein n=1 Tax=Capnocytophaga gingivalis TaxID=1017 RepID=UPI0028EE835E|nr:SMI1/KNR4 family protein [Capnocytophaga gingivalis]
MKKLTFEKYGLSPEKVEQLRAYKILPDKQTLKNLIKAYETDKITETELTDLQTQLSYLLDETYTHFLLEHNGGIPSKNRVKDSKVVIDRFLAFRSAYRFHSVIDLYPDFQQWGIPIARTPAGDTLLLAEDQQIYLFNHNIQDVEPNPIATSFANLLMKLY